MPFPLTTVNRRTDERVELCSYWADFVYLPGPHGSYTPELRAAVAGLKAAPETRRRALALLLADGRFVVEDAKGFRTEMYLLKRKWLEAEYGIVVREV